MGSRRAVAEESTLRYTHLKTTKNLDFTPNQVHLTLSNAKDKTSYVKGVDVLVQDVTTVKEYSCIQGLVAVDEKAMGDLPKIHEAMMCAARLSPRRAPRARAQAHQDRGRAVVEAVLQLGPRSLVSFPVVFIKEFYS